MSRTVDESSRALEALAALAQETRLSVFRHLVAVHPDGVPAGAIAERFGVPHNTLSSHLAILTRARLVASERRSRSILYRADLDGFRTLVTFLAQDCCRGRPEICAPVLESLAQGRACAPETSDG
jgi:ArsR family transcriptional regulator, arsenate/arsenite/antimonite-responsive transcriptional repressor